jgi:hypothetical protein
MWLTSAITNGSITAWVMSSRRPTIQSVTEGHLTPCRFNRICSEVQREALSF